MDFVKTIYSDDDDQCQDNDLDVEETKMDEEFMITGSKTENFFYDDFDMQPTSVKKPIKLDGKKTTLQQKIKKALTKRKQENKASGKIEATTEEIEEEIPEPEEIQNNEEPILETEHKQKKEPIASSGKKDWSDLDICKPLQKAVQDCGFEKPTLIQEMTIPVTLTGRDVLASSITGSGKTAAFLQPIMQRVWKQKYGSYTAAYSKCLIILPTREQAIQCADMFKLLNKYTKLSSCVIIGKVSSSDQEIELRRGPDFIIATPGRIIDLAKNAKDFTLDDIEYLVFDEADKLLDLGFKHEIQEIVDLTNSDRRQTLLFSATQGKNVLNVVKISLNKPLRVQANPDNRVNEKLRQEVVKITNRDERMGALIFLLEKYFKKRTIVFFRTKAECHRTAIILGLRNHLNVAELHGNLTQVERINALDDFKTGACDILLASDLVARGLDIKNVKFVLNYELPQEMTRYIHRVGRTARAGESGVCLTIVDPTELQKLKGVVKTTREKLFVRPISIEAMKVIDNEIYEMDEDIGNVYKQERFERELIAAEREAQRAQNLMVHRDDIYSRPKKEWIVSNFQKTKLKEQAKDIIEGGAEVEAANTMKFGKDSKFQKDMKNSKDLKYAKKEAKHGKIDKSVKEYKKTDTKPLSKKSKKIVRNKNRTVNKKGQKKSNVNYKKRN